MTTHYMTQNQVTTEKPKSQDFTRYAKFLPSALYLIAAALLLGSIAFPYWGLVLQAPQYPGGLEMRVFVNRMTGDADPALDEVNEIDGLNHYIGMQSLYSAAKVERSIALPAVIIMAILLVIAALWRKRYTWLLAIPALTFPVVFLADLGLWMRYYGQNLDPYAPLSSAIQPFVPPVLGEGVIGQFSTVSYVNTGWYMVAVASVLIIAAFAFQLWASRNNRGS
jgi:copper chaperone NosL